MRQEGIAFSLSSEKFGTNNFAFVFLETATNGNYINLRVVKNVYGVGKI